MAIRVILPAAGSLAMGGIHSLYCIVLYAAAAHGAALMPATPTVHLAPNILPAAYESALGDSGLRDYTKSETNLLPLSSAAFQPMRKTTCHIKHTISVIVEPHVIKPND